jgi:hypothetical protein
MAKSKNPQAEPTAPSGPRRVVTLTGEFNQEWPSFELIPLAQAIADVAEGVEVGQRKTTVFLKHPDHKKQLITFFGSTAKPAAFSPFLTKKDGAAPDTLGLMTIRFKDAEHGGRIGERILKRAKII